MFSHVMVGADDIDLSKKFYDAVFGELGIAPGQVDPKGRVFYRCPTGSFGIGKPINGQSACAANGGTIGFVADTPDSIDKWHAAGVANGGHPAKIRQGFAKGPLASFTSLICETPPATRSAS